MKTVVLALAAAIGLSTAANAADMPVKARPAPPVAAFNWTGFYIGGNVGWARTDATYDSYVVTPQGFAPASVVFVNAMADGTSRNNGWTGGVQAGYNWQGASPFVLGVEADINALSAQTSLTAVGTTPGGTVITNFTNSMDPKWIATFRGRLGYTFNMSLLYVTGGLAVLNSDYNQTFVATLPINTVQTTNSTKAGWTVGGGWEQALNNNWSIKAEYLFARFEGVNANVTAPLVAGFTDAIAGTANVDIHQARIGVNYRFGGPVVAKY